MTVEVAARETGSVVVAAVFGPTAAPPGVELEVLDDGLLLEMVEVPAEFGATAAPAELVVVFENGA